MTPDDPTPTPEQRDLLARFHFDRVPFEALRARLRGTRSPESLHMITRPVTAPDVGAVVSLPRDGGERAALERDGLAMIARGELAVVILAGGMATRFGSAVKGLAPLLEGEPLRFVDAKLADVARAGKLAGRAIDTTLLSSFATDAALRDALDTAPVHIAPQFVSLRLAPDGSLFTDDDGLLSPHAPGHGDLPDALRTAGAIDRWKAGGVRTVLVSNVDNIGATVDPALLALHARSVAKISVELVDKAAGDKGGLPVLHDGRLVLAEAFRLPSDFPHDRFPMFNTNTLWIDVAALEPEREWTWCVARKSVDGREAIQFERLVGELTWWEETQYVRVPRTGEASRFLPVKDLDDLARSQPALREVLRARVGLDV